MTFPLNQSPQPGPLQAPGQLFNRPASPAPAASEPVKPLPPLRADQARFSSVSRLVQHLPPLSLPALPTLPTLRRLPEHVLNGLERGWTALKQTFIFQFGEVGRVPGATAKEAQANCGPASSAMILKQFGLSSPSMNQLRRLVGAPIGSKSGPYALNTTQVAEAVKRTAKEKGVQIKYDIKPLSSNVDVVLNEMKRRLAAGEKLILLTSNINTLSRGHYVVVKEVRPDGSIVVDDPGRQQGENLVQTKQQLARALKTRTQTYGLGSSLIAFQRH